MGLLVGTVPTFCIPGISEVSCALSPFSFRGGDLIGASRTLQVDRS